MHLEFKSTLKMIIHTHTQKHTNLPRNKNILEKLKFNFKNKKKTLNYVYVI